MKKNSRNRTRTVTTLAAFCVLSATTQGCATYRIEQAQKQPPAPNAYTSALHQEYLGLAKDYLHAGREWTSFKFANRALQAGNGKAPDPYTVPEDVYPPEMKRDAQTGAHALTDLIRSGGAQHTPLRTARAQANFDCWMTELDRETYAPHADRCMNMFQGAIESAETERGEHKKDRKHASSPLSPDLLEPLSPKEESESTAVFAAPFPVSPVDEAPLTIISEPFAPENGE